MVVRLSKLRSLRKTFYKMDGNCTNCCALRRLAFFLTLCFTAIIVSAVCTVRHICGCVLSIGVNVVRNRSMVGRYTEPAGWLCRANIASNAWCRLAWPEQFFRLKKFCTICKRCLEVNLFLMKWLTKLDIDQVTAGIKSNFEESKNHTSKKTLFIANKRTRIYIHKRYWLPSHSLYTEPL